MDTNIRQVRIALIVMTQSYDKRSPLFLLKNNRVLFEDLGGYPPYGPSDAITQILKDNLGIDYHKSRGAENWVVPHLEDAISTEDGVIVIVYSCLIPEASRPDDESLQWKTITDILTDAENISGYDRKIISNFAIGE